MVSSDVQEVHAQHKLAGHRLQLIKSSHHFRHIISDAAATMNKSRTSRDLADEDLLKLPAPQASA
jgi:hypothetical protein